MKTVKMARQSREQSADLNSVQDAIDGLGKVMAILDEGMGATHDGMVEAGMSAIWEQVNTAMGEAIKLRGRLETQ